MIKYHFSLHFYLQGVKSGEILLNGDILPPGSLPPGYTRDSQGRPVKDDDLSGKHDVQGKDDEDDGKHRKPSGKKLGALGNKPNLADHDGPILHVDLVKAKNLIKSDMIGKSDPYAVLKYDQQQDKTKVINNTQNPEWDHSSDFAMDPETASGYDAPKIM